MISRRDIIKDEIEKIAQVFGHFLAKLLGTAGNNPGLVAIGDLEKAMQEKLGFDLKTIMALEDKALHAFLVSHHFDVTNLEIFGDLLVSLGKQEVMDDYEEGLAYFKKGLDLYLLADGGSDAYSMVLVGKITEVRQVLLPSGGSI